MKKLSKEQCERFMSVRDKLLEEVKIFELGVSYFEKNAEHNEGFDKSWIYKLQDTIKALDLEEGEFEGRSIEFDKCSDFSFGMLVATYFSRIDAIMFAGLGKIIIEPFDRLLPEYKEQVIEILRP